MSRPIIILLSILFFYACDDQIQPWPHGHIPFNLIGFSAEESLVIYQCMTAWEAAAGGHIKFVDTMFANDKDISDKTKILRIIKGSQNQDLGEATQGEGYSQDMQQWIMLFSITNNPKDIHTILHGIGHKLGLMHEHQRPDRDIYLTILEIYPGNELQFYYKIPNLYDYKDYPYDYQSIMHYKDGAGVQIDGHGHELGSDTISLIDAQKIRDIYGNKQQELFDSINYPIK